MHMNTRQTSISSGMCHRRRRDSPVTEDQRHGLGVAIMAPVCIRSLVELSVYSQ